MRTTSILFLTTALAGCAALHKPAPVGGSFAVNVQPADDKRLAADAAARLVALYPPALTRFSLRHAAADPFGAALVATLREKGYALQEYKAAGNNTPAAKEGARALSYVFDEPADDLYRVTVSIDEQSLSRLYRAKDGTLAAASSWVRKE